MSDHYSIWVRLENRLFFWLRKRWHMRVDERRRLEQEEWP